MTTFLLLLFIAARVIGTSVIGTIYRISRPFAASAAAVLVVFFLITFVTARQLMSRFQ
jgi:hypothetical protein